MHHHRDDGGNDDGDGQDPPEASVRCIIARCCPLAVRRRSSLIRPAGGVWTAHPPVSDRPLRLCCMEGGTPTVAASDSG